MKKVLSCLLLLFLIGFVSAATGQLGTYKKDTCFPLLQVCDNCTYNNITAVLYPNNSEALGEVKMTQDGKNYNYTFCNSSIIGTYKVLGQGDDGGIDTPWAYTFEVNAIGQESTDARTQAVNRGIYFVYGIAALFFIAFIFTKSESSIIKEGGMIEVKNNTVLKWSFFLISILFLMVGTNSTFISIYNDVGDDQIGAIFDKLAVGSTYLFYFCFGILIFIWIYATIASLADKKRMQQAYAVGGNFNYG